MKVIKEYRLKKDIIATQTLYINKGAEIVSLVDMGYNELALFTLCDPLSTDTDLRTFRVCPTYATIYDNDIRYVGSFELNQHVIEVL